MAGGGRRRWAPVGFMVVWLTFWTSGILVALWQLGAAALGGQPGAVLSLAFWLAAAGFARWNGGRHLKALLMDERAPARPAPDHTWRDGKGDPR